MEDECLLPVGPHTLPEGFFARKPVIECRDAAFMGDDTASHALNPVKVIREPKNIAIEEKTNNFS